MTKKETEYLQGVLDQEGFDYAFTSYSSFENIKDKKLHKLIEQYVETQHELEEYIKSEYARHEIAEL